MRTEPNLKPDSGGRESARDDLRPARRPPPAEGVERFASLMAGADTPLPRTAVEPDEPDDRSAPESEALQTAAIDPRVLAIQRLVFEASSGMGPPPTTMAATLADLVERHVRQLLVDEAAVSGNGRGRVMLRLSEDLLPATDLMLSRTADGWSLHSESIDGRTEAMIEAAAPALIERFAQAKLGVLQVRTARARP